MEAQSEKAGAAWGALSQALRGAATGGGKPSSLELTFSSVGDLEES